MCTLGKSPHNKVLLKGLNAVRDTRKYEIPSKKYELLRSNGIPRSTGYQEILDMMQRELSGSTRYQDARDIRNCEIPKSTRYQDA